MNVEIENFTEFLQNLINEKFDTFLHTLFKLFGQFFIIVKSIMDLLFILEEQLPGRVYVQNALYILNKIFVDHPEFICMNYCNNFQLLDDEIVRLKANIHQINHIQVESYQAKQLKQTLNQIEEQIRVLEHKHENIVQEISQQSIILKQKEEIFKNFNDKVLYIHKKYQFLREDQLFLKYYQLYCLFQQQQHRQSIQDLFNIINQYIKLAQSFFQLMENPIQYAQKAKNLPKKSFKGTGHEQNLIYKYSNLISNVEQLWVSVTLQNYEDIIETIKSLEKQPFTEDISKSYYQGFHIQDFRQIINNKEQLNHRFISSLRKQELISDWTMNPPIQVSLIQIQNILPSFLGAISGFLILQSLFRTTQKDIQSFFLQKFQVNVQLSCPDLE
ncbi:hypothetical protein pb186bvf_017842 [Paramecium bursaria]